MQLETEMLPSLENGARVLHIIIIAQLYGDLADALDVIFCLYVYTFYCVDKSIRHMYNLST